MKLANGAHTFTSSGGLSMRFQATDAGGSATMDDFTYDPVADAYVAVHVNIVIEIHSDGTFQGATGLPPNQKFYTGSWT